ncbi:MAG TPA: pyruvate kinase [Deltaproteobacteria bacterium]|jgi:pyruvate kinase|nr:pyruvate kinase [Deltaproteobacteria bacterium]
MVIMGNPLPGHKTKIVCTIGPATRGEYNIRRLMLAGMSVARLNLSHGDPAAHAADIAKIRKVEGELDRNVPILADLPGPKIRIGHLKGGSALLRQGDRVMLTLREVEGTSSLIPVQFKDLPDCVEPGQRIFLADGFIQLKVLQKTARDVICQVVIGGTLLSKKGMNLPDSSLDLEAVTPADLELMAFGLEQGVDMFGLSFVSSPDDIERVRAFARERGKRPFLIAKIERAQALERIDEIIAAADGIMVARGDLGVEISVEEVPIVQKQLILKANLAAKPVITATQVLESMTENTRPTRAEVTDAANAVFDGTDALMLSEETAVGRYPLEALEMLSKVVMTAETRRSTVVSGTVVPDTIMYAIELAGRTVEDTISLDVMRASVSLGIRSVVVPSKHGLTARRISRFKGDAWIFALCSDEAVARALCLSYGVVPVPLGSLASDEDMVLHLREKGCLGPRETLILVRSEPYSRIGSANTFKIITPGEE